MQCMSASYCRLALNPEMTALHLIHLQISPKSMAFSLILPTAYLSDAFPPDCMPVPGMAFLISSSGKPTFPNPVDTVTPSVRPLLLAPELAIHAWALLNSGHTSPLALYHLQRLAFDSVTPIRLMVPMRQGQHPFGSVSLTPTWCLAQNYLCVCVYMHVCVSVYMYVLY